MTTTTNRNNVLFALAILGNFNRFSVDDGNRRFMCSGIDFVKSAPDCIEFQKQAAVSEFTGAIIDASATPDCLTLTEESGKAYRITAAHDSTLEKSASRAATLEGLIDWTRSGATGDLVRLVLDFGKLGLMTQMQNFRLKSWINRNFAGMRQSLQIPRTVYFQRDGSGKVEAGIYSLEDEKPVTCGVWWSNAALDRALDAVQAAA